MFRKHTFGHVRTASFILACAFAQSGQILHSAVRILDSQGCKVSSCGQQSLWSDSTGTQADLNLRLMHISDGTFYHIEDFFITTYPTKAVHQ